MRRAPGDQGLERGCVDGAAGIARQGGWRGAERVRQKQPCVEARIVDAGFAQARGGLIERLKRRNGRAGQAPVTRPGRLLALPVRGAAGASGPWHRQ
jgi:hypothetical protein